MTIFFFYNNLTNINLITKIDTNFSIINGYIFIEYYNENTIKINNNSTYNTKILYGKIVIFNYDLDYILDKINKLDCIKNDKIDKYNITTKPVYSYNKQYDAYIIF